MGSSARLDARRQYSVVAGLCGFSKSNPDRAATLMRQFKPGRQERAAGYGLEAMAEEADPALIVGLLRDLVGRGFDTAEFRNSAAHAVEKLLNRNHIIEEDIVALFEGWLASSPKSDPPENDKAQEEGEEDAVSNEKDASNEDGASQSILLDSSGFAVLPDGNYPVLATLIHILLRRGDAERERLLKILDSHLERETDVNVWRAMLRYLDYVPGERLAFFVERLFARFPELAASSEGVRLLAHMFWSTPLLIKKIISPWPDSERVRTRVAYGELVTLIALATPGADVGAGGGAFRHRR